MVLNSFKQKELLAIQRRYRERKYFHGTARSSVSPFTPFPLETRSILLARRTVLLPSGEKRAAPLDALLWVVQESLAARLSGSRHGTEAAGQGTDS